MTPQVLCARAGRCSVALEGRVGILIFLFCSMRRTQTRVLTTSRLVGPRRELRLFCVALIIRASTGHGYDLL